MIALIQELSLSAQNHSKITSWCLTAGSVGHEAQCLGIFETLGLDPVIKRVNPKGKWYRNLAPIGPAEAHPDIIQPWPDLLISAGRQALPYVRQIRRRSRGCTFVAVLQKPGLPSCWFDFIWTPLHDKLSGSNVLSTITPPNRLFVDKVAEDAIKYQNIIVNLPKPIVTVLLGGPSRSFQFDLQTAEKFANDLVQLHNNTGCGFLITPSYRTGDTLINYFSHRLAHIPAIIANLNIENPYLGYLGVADFIIVTADSINMLGEAAFTGRPVYAYPVPYRHHKFLTFYQNLIDYGAMRWFNGNLEHWHYEPLNATPQIANEIWSRLLLHRKALRP